MKVFRSILLLVTVLALLSPLESYLVAAQVQPPEVHNPIIVRVASLTTPGSTPYAPSDIRKAYDFLPLYGRGINGTGTRIAIVDAYGSSSLSTDLASFDSLTGLPTATVNTYYPDGVPKKCLTNTCVGWAEETSLDVEWAHAIAPQATIDLIIAVDASLLHVYDAISYVANNLPSETVLSMSFGAAESAYPATGAGSIAATHQLFATMTGHGTTPFASSGDNGASSCCAPSYPASDPLVMAVGGTSLSLNSTAGYVGETTWSGSGAGASTIFTKPAYQQGLGDSMRDDVDVSYNADPNTGVLVIYKGSQFEAGGTSAGSPQWAGLIALASEANGTRLGSIQPQLYPLTSYHDVKTGSDGFFSASTGWDYPTGLGTPDATAIVNSLSAKTGDVAVAGIVASRNFAYAGVSANPIVVNVTVTNIGSQAQTLTLTLKANATFVGNVTLTITGTGTKIVAFDWDTSQVTRGNYEFSAQVSLLNGVVDIGNNSLTSTTVFVARMAGDVNNDCRVDITDLVTVGRAFGSTPSSVLWNSNADMFNDGKISITDLVLVGGNFGSHC